MFSMDEHGKNPNSETVGSEPCFQITCADQPEPRIGGGEQSSVIFEHKNLANLVSLTDMNCLSAIEWAIDTLHVERIVIWGHYDCKSVAAVANGDLTGISRNWLIPVKRAVDKYSHLLKAHPLDPHGSARLCELNAIEQGLNLCRTAAVVKAWEFGRRLSVQSQIYDSRAMTAENLGFTACSRADIERSYEEALSEFMRRWGLAR